MLTLLLACGDAEPDSILDPGFGEGGVAHVPLSTFDPAVPGGFYLGPPVDVRIEPDGHILVGLGALAAVVGFTPDGQLDTAYGDGGVTFAGGFQGDAIALRPGGGGVYSVGIYDAMGGQPAGGVAAYTASGAVDTAYGQGGLAYAETLPAPGVVLALADGRALVGGSRDRTLWNGGEACVVRLDASGQADPTYGVDGFAYFDPLNSFAELGTQWTARSIAEDAGAVWVAAESDQHVGNAIARLDADGALDPTWGGEGWIVGPRPDEAGWPGLGVAADGALLAMTYREFEVLRYLPDGSADPAWGAGGVATYAGPDGLGLAGARLAPAADGSVYVAGSISAWGAVVKYLPDGTPDLGFGEGGAALTDFEARFVAAVPLPDGRVLAAGTTANDDVLLVMFASPEP